MPYHIDDFLDKFPDHDADFLKMCLLKTADETGLPYGEVLNILYEKVSMATHFDDLPYERIFQIALYLNDEELALFCQVSSSMARVCKDESFWHQRVIDETGNADYKRVEETWKQEYQKLTKPGVSVQYIVVRRGSEVPSTAMTVGEPVVNHLNAILETKEQLQIPEDPYVNDVTEILPHGSTAPRRGLRIFGGGQSEYIYVASQDGFYSLKDRSRLRELLGNIENYKKGEWVQAEDLGRILDSDLRRTSGVFGRTDDTLPLYYSSYEKSWYIQYNSVLGVYIVISLP